MGMLTGGAPADLTDRYWPWNSRWRRSTVMSGARGADLQVPAPRGAGAGRMRPVYVLGAGAYPGKFPDKLQLQLALDALGAALRDAALEWRDLQGLVAASSRFEGGMGWVCTPMRSCKLWPRTASLPAMSAAAVPPAALLVQTAFAMIYERPGRYRGGGRCRAHAQGLYPRPPGSASDITDNDYLRWVAMGATNPAYWAMERRRMHEHGTTAETLAQASVLMHRNAIGNPLARYRKACSVAEVLASPMVSDPLHLLEICAVSDGAAAIVLGSEAQARQRGGHLIEVAGCAIASGQFGDLFPALSPTWPAPRTLAHPTPARWWARCSGRWPPAASGPRTSTCSESGRQHGLAPAGLARTVRLLRGRPGRLDADAGG